MKTPEGIPTINGDRPNEHGVYLVPTEVIEMNEDPKNLWDYQIRVRLAELENGRWIYAYSAMFSVGSYAAMSMPLSATWGTFATRDEVLLKAGRGLIDWIKPEIRRHDSQRRQARRMIRWVENTLLQKSLFPA